MKYLPSLLFLFFCLNIVYSQQCPSINYVFDSQAKIDAFPTNYPNCHELEILKIEGEGITDLSPLNQLSSIKDIISINSTSLINLEGLGSLELGGLTECDVFITENPYLTSLNGLSVNGNPDRGIGVISIIGNPNLSSIEALASIKTHCYALVLNFNNSLNNFQGTENIPSLTILNIIGNQSLQSIEALNISGNLGQLVITNNPLLQNLSGLDDINFIDMEIVIDNNDLLENLDALRNIVDDHIFLVNILNNEALNDISGLKNLTIGEPPNAPGVLRIINNPNLSYCHIESVCLLLENSEDYEIANNNTNCNSSEEVIELCNNPNPDVENENEGANFAIFPIPIASELTVQLPEGINLISIAIYSIYGDRLINTTVNEIDFSNISSGIYIIEIATNKETITKKIVKQ